MRSWLPGRAHGIFYSYHIGLSKGYLSLDKPVNRGGGFKCYKLSMCHEWWDQCKKAFRMGECPEAGKRRFELLIKNTVHHISACLRF
jgi:hypothetical protein